MDMKSRRLTLERQSVYGWTMYPGYGGGPYRSPIIALEVIPLGGRTLELSFLNVFYAAGVQEMNFRLRTLKRERCFYIAEVIEIDGPADRAVVIEPMTPQWIEDLVPSLKGRIDSYFSPDGTPYNDAFKRLMSSAF